MRISHKHKFVYIAVPKTASTVVRLALDGRMREDKKPYADIVSVPDESSPYNHHTTASELKKHFKEMGWNWDEYFKFSFVRNPWERLVSFYFYKKRYYETNGFVERWPSRVLNEPFMEICKEQTLGKSFGEFLEIAWEAKCSDFLYEGDSLLLDFVGRTETLQQDFNKVCSKVGIPQTKLSNKEVHANRSNHGYYCKHYDDKTRKVVEERYKTDIEHFGYEFGE